MAAIRIDLTKARPRTNAPTPEARPAAAPAAHAPVPIKKLAPALKKPVYTKVFRWQPPVGAPQPATVEVAGSFNGWQKLPLAYVAATHTWQLMIPDVPSNRTHHYMMLADGQPVSDQNCDGLALPEGPQEQQFQLTTPRGPRVFMLFAQTK